MSEKLSILVDVLGPYRASNQEHLFACPYCQHHKKKFSVNIEKNVYKCWVCDTRGLDIYQVVRRHGSFKNCQEWRAISGQVDLSGFESIFNEESIEKREEKVPLPDELVSLVTDTTSLEARNALSYLRHRGVTDGDLLKWKIGFCPEGEYRNRIIIPSFGMTGYANFFVARTYKNDWKKYKNPRANKDIIFNELYVDWRKDIILVEGAFDAIRASTVGSPIPLLGSTLRAESKLFQRLVEGNSNIYLALDADADYKSALIAQNLLSYGKKLYKIDTSGYEDVAEIPDPILVKRKKEASLISLDNYFFQKIRSI
jgi:DNA primase